MQKLFIGCGSLVLLLITMLFGLLSLLTDCGENLSRGRSESRIKKQVDAHDARFSFTPPADGLVTADQMKKWLASRDPLLGPPSLCDFNFSIENAGTRENAVKVHIESLARQGMSMNEYAWIAKTVVGVLHSNQARANPVLKQLISDIEHQRMNVFEADESHLTPEQIGRLMPIIESNREGIIITIAVFTFDYMVLIGFRS